MTALQPPNRLTRDAAGISFVAPVVTPAALVKRAHSTRAAAAKRSLVMNAKHGMAPLTRAT